MSDDLSVAVRWVFMAIGEVFIGKAKRLLGYRPKYGLYDGLHRTALWYKEQGLV